MPKPPSNSHRPLVLWFEWLGRQETGFDIVLSSTRCVFTSMWVGGYDWRNQQSVQLSKRLQQWADVVNSNWQSPRGAAHTIVLSGRIPFCVCQHPVLLRPSGSRVNRMRLPIRGGHSTLNTVGHQEVDEDECWSLGGVLMMRRGRQQDVMVMAKQSKVSDLSICALTAQCGVGRVIGHQLHMVPYHVWLWSLPEGRIVWGSFQD